MTYLPIPSPCLNLLGLSPQEDCESYMDDSRADLRSNTDVLEDMGHTLQALN